LLDALFCGHASTATSTHCALNYVSAVVVLCDRVSDGFARKNVMCPAVSCV